MHIQDCLEEILHLEDTDLAASLADASRLFSCKKRQLVAKPDACSDWIPFLVSGVIRGYLTDEKGRDITDCFLYRPGEAVLSLSILTASFPINFEAVTDCVLLSIPTQLLAEQFQQSAELQQLYSSYLLEKLKLERELKFPLHLCEIRKDQGESEMKKRFFALFLTMALLLPAVLLSGCASADSGIMDTANLNATAAGGDSSLPVVTWKMGSVWGAGNVHFTVDQRFAELVSQLTDGRFIITNYSEGELCSASQLFDFVSQGTVECGGDWGGYWSGKDTAFELLSTIMDDFTALDYYTWIYEAGGMDCYKEMYGQYNMEYFPLVTNPSESGIRSVSPITSIEDMQHMKIRLGGVMAGKAAQKLGINITTVAASELYESLQRGVIDGGEFSGPKADDSLKLQEVAPYWCAPAWYQSAGVNGVMVNKQAWESLPEAYQVAFESAARLCCGEQLSRYIYNDMTVTNQMIEDQGVTVTSLSDEDMQLIRETCIETYKEECEINPNFKMVYESMQAYRETANNYRDWTGDYGFGFNRGE